MSGRAGLRILVPVFGGDISAAVEERARRLVAAPGARLAVVHMAAPRAAVRAAVRPPNVGGPRWRRLAEDAGAFVDAVPGGPAAIATQARRFASDIVLVDRRARPRPHPARPRRRTRREKKAC